MCRCRSKLLFRLLFLCFPIHGSRRGAQPARSPSAPATQAQIAALQQAVQNAQASGDNAWVLISAALVLLMTAPGLTLFYGGLVRRKNILGTMMQSFAMMGLITVLWALVGYSLAFGAGNGFIGGLEHAFLRGVGLAPNPNYGGTIPEQTFMVYQLMFAIITPALITGAFAERVKFSAMAVFLCLWSLVVYCPMAHMIWGVGGILNLAGGHWPVLDFAGGTVVHITSGVSALVCCLYLGKRAGYPQEDMPPHSMVLSFIGAGMLWVGWFGFNAGSALTAGPLATSAFVNTQFAAAAAAIGWVVAEWIQNGKPTALGAISGAVAGLATITQASGFVQPMCALAHRPHRRRRLLLHGLPRQEILRLRRLARRLWRARRRRNHGRAAHRPASPPAPSMPSSARTPPAIPGPPAPSTATGIRLSTRPSAWASDGRWPSSARWCCSSWWTRPWACASLPAKKPPASTSPARRGRLRPQLLLQPGGAFAHTRFANTRNSQCSRLKP